MSIRRRAGSPYWYYDFTLDGCRYRGCTRTAVRETATLVEHQIRERLLRGTYRQAADTLTLAAALDLYRAHHAEHLPSWRTVRTHIETLPGLLRGSTPVGQIDNAAVARMTARLRDGRAAGYPAAG